MQKVTAQAAHGSIDEYVLMHCILTPPRMPSIEEAHAPVGISLAMAQPLTKKSVSAPHRVRGAAAIRECAADLTHELIRNPLVRIEAEYPFVARRRHPEVLLWAEAQPCLRDDSRAAAARNF